MRVSVNNIQFYCAWFCPYAQRAWIALEHHKIPYNYVESLIVREDQDGGDHGYDKNPKLLAINPKGLVPTIDLPTRIVDETELLRKQKEGEAFRTLSIKPIDDEERNEPAMVLMESLDCVEFLNSLGEMCNDKEAYCDLIPDSSLLKDAEDMNKNVCSTFYKVLMKPTFEEQKEAFEYFSKYIGEYVNDILDGGFYKSTTLTIVDVTVIPWILRLPLLRHYRPTLCIEDYINEEQYKKLEKYIQRINALEAVKNTLWDDFDKLLAVYVRYADGTATSQVGQAVKSGKNAHDI